MRGNPPVTGGFPHKGPVMQKAFNCHGVFMTSPWFTWTWGVGRLLVTGIVTVRLAVTDLLQDHTLVPVHTLELILGTTVGWKVTHTY